LEIIHRKYPLSIPSRRLLTNITPESTALVLVRYVRLGELGHLLRELQRNGLVLISNDDSKFYFEPCTALLNHQECSGMLPVLSPEIVKSVKSAVMRFLEPTLGDEAILIEEEVQRADCFETLLISLGNAQRALFDMYGRECAHEFFVKIVEPLLSSA
jgi:hypothetical protein